MTEQEAHPDWTTPGASRRRFLALAAGGGSDQACGQRRAMRAMTRLIGTR